MEIISQRQQFNNRHFYFDVYLLDVCWKLIAVTYIETRFTVHGYNQFIPVVTALKDRRGM